MRHWRSSSRSTRRSVATVRGFAPEICAPGAALRSIALIMDYHKDPTKSICTRCYKMLLGSGTRVFNGESHRVSKHLFGVSEADPMLAQVGPCLGRDSPEPVTLARDDHPWAYLAKVSRYST